MKSLEQVVECLAPVAVRPQRRSCAPLQRRRFEQTAVEKGNPAERQHRRGPLGGGAVQCAEDEGMKGRAMEVTAAGERVIEQLRQVASITVEPSLFLDEIQKQHPRQSGE